jgi:hypothetical protein
MLIKSFTGPFEHVIIENYYDHDELELMWKEIEFLTPNLLNPEFTNSATENGSSLKQGKGIFLEDVYKNRNLSYILRFNRKLWHPTILHELEKISPWWKSIRLCNKDYTLLNYYQNESFYKPHTDNSVITAISVLYKDEKNFDGGDLIFSEYNLTIPKLSNSLIIFPSQVFHSVSDIQMKNEGNFGGRYSMAQFLYING